MSEGQHSKTETTKRNLFESTTKVGKRVNQCARKLKEVTKLLSYALAAFHTKQNGTLQHFVLHQKYIQIALNAARIPFRRELPSWTSF
jgi:hypothetical protein